MKEKEFTEIFGTVPVFTLKEVSSIIGNPSYAKQYLIRLKKRGSILSLGRGLYTLHEDPMIYASHIIYPSYVSLTSAFQYYGTTTQLPSKVEIISPSSGNYPGVEIIKGREIWGYGKIEYSGFEVFMAHLEKAVIDSIILERSPLEEIGGAVEKSDAKQLESYAVRLRISDIKRVGYVLSLFGIDLAEARERARADRNYVRSIYFRGTNDWRVIDA